MESHSSAQSSLFSAPDEEPHFKKLSPSWTQAGFEKPLNGSDGNNYPSRPSQNEALKTRGERRHTATLLMEKVNEKWSNSEA